jgi:ABC-type Zn uptake system ZnuABC Zn-binding protein ZnuA
MLSSNNTFLSKNYNNIIEQFKNIEKTLIQNIKDTKQRYVKNLEILGCNKNDIKY